MSAPDPAHAWLSEHLTNLRQLAVLKVVRTCMDGLLSKGLEPDSVKEHVALLIDALIVVGITASEIQDAVSLTQALEKVQS